MTTDNRPNEQVEAAARALASRGPMRIVIAWEDLYEFERRVFREGARAALVAAQGAGKEENDVVVH